MHTWGLVFGVLLAGSLSGGVVDVTGSPSVWLRSGDQLEFDVGVANFARNNLDAPTPSQLTLLLLTAPNQGPLAALPGSTAQYYSGFALQAQLASTLFEDSAAARAGFGEGTLLLRDGSLASGDGTRAIGMVSGSANFDATAALALFGPQAQNIVRILLTNLGADLWLGAGDGYTLRTSFWLQTSGGTGTVQTTGTVREVWLTPKLVPEPNSGLLTLVPLIAAALLLFGYHLLSRAWINLSSKNGYSTTSSR